MLSYYFTRNTSRAGHGLMLALSLAAKCNTDEDICRKFMQDKFLYFSEVQPVLTTPQCFVASRNLYLGNRSQWWRFLF